MATVTNKHLITDPRETGGFVCPRYSMFNEENPRLEGARPDHV